jgi:dipeptidyl aminopeptidase/acylaminoacyl peptidase
MRIMSRITIALLVSCISLLAAEDRRFSVRDSIEMNTFSEPSGRDTSAVVQRSPDGKYSLVVTSRGLISSNEVESTVWLFDNAPIQKFMRDMSGTYRLPLPRKLATLSEVPVAEASNSYEAVVSNLRWTPDSRSIYFLAQRSNGLHQLCAIDVKTAVVRPLTPSGYNVERYSFLGRVVLYTATHRDRSQFAGGSTPRIQRPTVVTGMPLGNILFPYNSAWPIARSHELWSIREGHARQIVNLASRSPTLDTYHDSDVLSISPDGRSVIQIKPVTDIPESWEAYEPQVGFEGWRFHHDNFKATSPNNEFRARQYVLVDITTGRTRPLIDAPYGEALAHLEKAQATWSRDGKRVLLTNTFLPLKDVDKSTLLQRTHPCSVAIVEIPSREVHCLAFSRNAMYVSSAENSAPLRLKAAAFGVNDDEVILKFGWWQDNRNLTERYRSLNGQWQIVEKDHGLPTGDKQPNVEGSAGAFSLRIKQSLNEPPVLWATNAVTGTEREIWDPNPQFANMAFGTASKYHWIDPTGFEWTGGLIMPVDYVPGRRYPLVLETHGFHDSEFITDGQYTTAMAARPLASAGIIVLQVPDNYEHHQELSEAAVNVLGYESAVDQLTLDGLIDPKRVGIIGFSRTSWYVESSLIKNPRRFAAASIADGIDYSYMQELIFGSDQTSEGQTVYGTKPFGEGLKKWLEWAPGFHLDKIQTPLLLTSITPMSVLTEWEIYSSLFQQKKPVELLYIPGGQHILQKPQDRLASQQGAVDWYQFWLNDTERPNPEDKEQYRRWEGLCDLQKKSAPDQPTFCVATKH